MERQKNPGQHGDGNGHAVISDLNAEDGKVLSHMIEVDAQVWKIDRFTHKRLPFIKR